MGLIVCASHPLLHITLLLAEPIALYYYNDNELPIDWSLAYFMYVHIVCLVTQLLAYYFRLKKDFEVSKIFAIAGVPFYLYFIYVAHYEHLKD